jgi:thiamine biosynthesis lipoprotein
VISTQEEVARRAIKKAFDEIRRIERLMNVFCDRSEISRLNEGGKQIAITDDTYRVLEESLKYSRLTSGAFDPTIYRLMEVWFYKNESERPPEHEVISDLLDLTGYEYIELLDGGCAVIKKKGVKIDLGGVCKGYAVDKAIECFQRQGIRDALINLGGNIRVIGVPGHKEKWRIGIRHPRKGNEIFGVIELDGGGMATSGDYERYFLHNGKRYHHIIDPRTGYPSPNCVSVTVVAPNAILADILSTCIFVLGPDEGMKLVEETIGVEVVIVLPSGEVKTSIGLSNLGIPTRIDLPS